MQFGVRSLGYSVGLVAINETCQWLHTYTFRKAGANEVLGQMFPMYLSR